MEITMPEVSEETMTQIRKGIDWREDDDYCFHYWNDWHNSFESEFILTSKGLVWEMPEGKTYYDIPFFAGQQFINQKEQSLWVVQSINFDEYEDAEGLFLINLTIKKLSATLITLHLDSYNLMASYTEKPTCKECGCDEVELTREMLENTHCGNGGMREFLPSRDYQIKCGHCNAIRHVGIPLPTVDRLLLFAQRLSTDDLEKVKSGLDSLMIARSIKECEHTHIINGVCQNCGKKFTLTEDNGDEYDN